MDMNRRQFGKNVALAGLAVAFMPALDGCSGNEVESLINTVADSALAVIAVASPGSPWITPLTNAVAALKAAEATWIGGGAVAVVEQALGTIETVLAAIPLTAVYAPLVAVLVAGIDAVLNALPVSVAVTQAKFKATTNPYHGRATLKKRHLFQTRVGAYKGQWNNEAKSLNLPGAVIS